MQRSNQAHPPLYDGVINLYYAVIDGNDIKDESPALKQLTPDQYRRAAQKKSPFRVQYIKQRLMLNQVLKSHLSQGPLSFDVGAMGKPQLASSLLTATPIDFNLSHCAEIMMVAVTLSNPLGLDICQHKLLNAQYQRLVSACLSPAEQQQIQRPEDFYHFFALKESWLKAQGDGWSKGLDAVEFNLSTQASDGQMSANQGELSSYLLPIPTLCLAQLPTPLISVAISCVRPINKVNWIHWPCAHYLP